MKTVEEVWDRYLRKLEELWGCPVETTALTKARKTHQCVVCSMPIIRGERYCRETLYPGLNNDNDTIFTYKAHEDCDKLWTVFGEEGELLPPQEWAEVLESYEIENPHPFSPTDDKRENEEKGAEGWNNRGLQHGGN